MSGLGLKGTVRIRCPRAVGYGVQKTSSQKAFKKHSPNTHTRSRQTSAVHALPDPTLPTARPSRPTPRFRTLPLKGTASARRRSTSHFRRRSRRSARCWERRTSGWRRSGWTRTLLRGARTPSGRRPAAQGCAASAATGAAPQHTLRVGEQLAVIFRSDNSSIEDRDYLLLTTPLATPRCSGSTLASQRLGLVHLVRG